MKHFIRTLSLFAIISTLSSCAFLNEKTVPMDYLSGNAKLDIRSFFEGNLDAFAIKQDKNGKIIDSYNLKVKGEWDGNKGVLKQNFYYRDGKKDSRTWLITVNSDGTFNAVGHDVANSAKGQQIGNAAQSIYSLMVSQDGQKREVNFEERMYLVDSKSMIMISKFKNKNSIASDDNASGKVITSFKKIVAEKPKTLKKADPIDDDLNLGDF